MTSPKSISEKTNLHPDNRHRNGYDFEALLKAVPELKPFVIANPNAQATIDFADPIAVKLLNKALLQTDYNIENWDLPSQNLVPPVPGRADYILYLADLLALSNNGIIPHGATVNALDVGTGANLIYPLLGNSIFGWSFVATDIYSSSFANCVKIIENNPQLADSISLQLQTNSRFIFKDIIQPSDLFSFTMCNPPFHASEDEAAKANERKTSNLDTDNQRNFSGQNAELWCEKGEIGFITQMIFESKRYAKQTLWFTTLVSKQGNLKQIYKLLQKVEASKIETIEMSQGHKNSRFVAWTFLSEQQRSEWKF